LQTPSDKPEPPRKRDAERTKASLLAAALKEFSQQGYSGARIDKIAARARCNIRMLYHYFGNKKNLYLAVLESAYDNILQQEAKVQIDYDQPLEGVLALLKFVYDYFEKHPEFEGLLRTENMMQGKFVLRSQHVTQAAFPLRQVMTDLVESGERKGVFREGLDPVQVYVTILSVSRFHLANAYSLSALLGTDLTRPDWRKARFRHACALLTAYLTLAPQDAKAPAEQALADA
jgi:AcrR family transcriptional regulator